MRFLATFLLLAMALSGGCASNTSTVMDWSTFPPGRYGLYERASGRLILFHHLKPGDTFGIEYRESVGSARSTALTIERKTDPSTGADAARVWRLPVKPNEYEWRPLPADAATADIPSAVVTTRS
jgi:hypothetical protein